MSRRDREMSPIPRFHRRGLQCRLIRDLHDLLILKLRLICSEIRLSRLLGHDLPISGGFGSFLDCRILSYTKHMTDGNRQIPYLPL